MAATESPSAPPSIEPRFPGFNGLRAIAALAVVMTHLSDTGGANALKSAATAGKVTVACVSKTTFMRVAGITSFTARAGATGQIEGLRSGDSPFVLCATGSTDPRSLGDGQIDFGGIFTKLTRYGYDGWAVLAWECASKHPEHGAADGAPFISRHMIGSAATACEADARSGAARARPRSVRGRPRGRLSPPIF